MQIQVMVRNIHWKQSSTTITSTQHSISIESLDTCYTRTLAFKLFYLNIYLFWKIFHSLYFCNLERSCKFKVQSFKVYVESIYNIHTRWAFKIDSTAKQKCNHTSIYADHYAHKSQNRVWNGTWPLGFFSAFPNQAGSATDLCDLFMEARL